MQSIQEQLKKRKFEKETKQVTEWGELAKEMTKYFKRNCFWLPYRYPIHLLYEKFKAIQKTDLQGDRFKYFLGMLKK